MILLAASNSLYSLEVAASTYRVARRPYLQARRDLRDRTECIVTQANSLLTTLKFILSKKATKIGEIITVGLTLCSKCQIDGEDYVNFCGLLRK